MSKTQLIQFRIGICEILAFHTSVIERDRVASKDIVVHNYFRPHRALFLVAKTTLALDTVHKGCLTKNTIKSRIPVIAMYVRLYHFSTLFDSSD